MSELAKAFNKAIRDRLQVHAAWLPIVNTFEIGEYGIFDNGIFQSLGNLKSKYPDVNLDVKTGDTAEIDFSSAGIRSTKLDAAGNTASTFASLGNAEATLKLHFDKKNSNVIKAKLTSTELKNIDEIANFLGRKRDWRKRFCVVSKVYRGEQCVVICSKEAGTEIAIKASADVLRQIEAGKVSGGFEFTSNNNSEFKSVGETGVLAIKLFKLNLFNRLKVLAGTEAATAVDVPATEEQPDDY